MGTTSSDVPHVVAQAEPLKVDELKLLHNGFANWINVGQSFCWCHFVCNILSSQMGRSDAH